MRRIDERSDSKLGPVMDRLIVLEKTNSRTISGPSSTSDSGGSADLMTMVAVAAHRPW